MSQARRRTWDLVLRSEPRAWRGRWEKEIEIRATSRRTGVRWRDGRDKASVGQRWTLDDSRAKAGG